MKTNYEVRYAAHQRMQKATTQHASVVTSLSKKCLLPMK